uniref:Uncharacterized protein n=1 Tax=Anopheles culicifacies TaxID=139723 RepID=A0A182LSU8_9DIPT
MGQRHHPNPAQANRTSYPCPAARENYSQCPHSSVLSAAHLPIARIATIFTTLSGGSHSDTNASTAYCANDRHMIAIWDGLRTSVDTHENRKAGQAPNASIKSGSVAEEIIAPAFERIEPRFETYSGRSQVRKTDYPVPGTFKSRKLEMALEVVEP